MADIESVIVVVGLFQLFVGIVIGYMYAVATKFDPKDKNG